MSIPRPSVETPSLETITSTFVARGLPAPVRLVPLSGAWMHQNYRVQFAVPDEPDRMLRRVVARVSARSLEHERAALTLARPIEGVPVVDEYVVLPRSELGWPAALSTLLPGICGSRVLRVAPDAAPVIGRDLGRVMGRLASTSMPGPATHAQDGRMLAMRRTWRAAWAALVGRSVEDARAAGTWLGPLSDRLLDRIHDQLPALDTAARWSLVHGDLHTSNLMYRSERVDAEPELVGVIDWEAALVGDSLAEWAPLLERRPERIASVLAGYGDERARAVLDDSDAVARLEVYTWTRSLVRLGLCRSALMHNEGGARRAHALEYARWVAQDWAERSAVRDRLRAALDVNLRTPVRPGRHSDPALRLVWRAIEALRHEPEPAAVAAGHLACTLASALLAAPLVPEDRHAGGWIEVGDRALEPLGPQAVPIAAEPIDDRASWIAELTEDLVATGPRRSTALACLWLALEGLNALGGDRPGTWPASDDQLRGIETYLRVVSALDRDKSPLPAAAQCVHAILGLAARRRIPVLTRGEALDETAALEALRNTWEDLTVFGSDVPHPIDVEAFRRSWPERNAEELTDPVVLPPLLLAISHIEDALPADPGTVLGALGALESR